MPASTIRAGAAEVDITPPMGIEMCGYGPYEKRVCTGVLDPLYARALWLESGEERLLVLTLDLCTIDISTRAEVVRILHEQCGLDGKNVFVAASHTHSGPATQLMVGWGERDPEYVDSLPRQFVKAARRCRLLHGDGKPCG